MPTLRIVNNYTQKFRLRVFGDVLGLGMVNDTKNKTEEKVKREYEVYAFKGLTEHKTWKSIKTIKVCATSSKDAEEIAKTVYPNADKYKVCLVKYILGDWSH